MIIQDCGNVALTSARRMDISIEPCIYHGGFHIEVWDATGHIGLAEREPLLIIYDTMFLSWHADSAFMARVTIPDTMFKAFKLKDGLSTSIVIQREGSGMDTFDLAATPEPSTLFLLGVSLLGATLWKKWKG